jgi:hypothetical protein
MPAGVEQAGFHLIPPLVESLGWERLVPPVDLPDKIAQFLETAGFGGVIDVGTISPVSEPHGSVERNRLKAEFAAGYFKGGRLEGLVDRVGQMDVLVGITRDSVEKAVYATIHDLFTIASFVRDERYGTDLANLVLMGRLMPRLIRAESRVRTAGDGRICKDVLDRMGSGPCPGSMTLPSEGLREILEFIANPENRLSS